MISAADFAEAKINIAKFRANGERYFSLFDKHIPTGLDVNDDVLLYKIGNVTTIKGIVDKNPIAKYHVYDRECVCKLAKIACQGTNIMGYATDTQEKYDMFEDKGMKFDLIIMNPPYAQKLHLKILTKAVDFLRNDNSVCVCLHPSRWIRRFNYWKTTVKIPVKDAEFLDFEKSSSVFTAAIGEHLMITVAAKNGSYDYKNGRNSYHG